MVVVTTSARASVCLLAVVAAVAGCGGDARRPVSPGIPEIRIGTFTGLSGGIGSLLSTEPLVSVGWDGRPVYRLAESVIASADGLALTVNLRQGVRFHTGESVTAPRVRELLTIKPRFMSEVDGIDVDGERTLIVRLKRPHSIKAEDLSEAPIDDDNRPQLRTGAFKVVSTGPTAVLQSFADYYQGAPSVSRVEIKEYPNHRSAWTAMMRQEVNFLHEVNREAIEFLEAGGDIQAYPLLRPYVVPLVFNLKHPILQRQEVRVALNEAIDRDEVVRNGMRGHGEPAEGPFWPHHWAYSPGRHMVPFNPEAARLRLDAAGLKVVDDGADHMPSRFRFRCILRSNDARFERIALVVQRQLSAVGVDMQLTLVPAKDFVNRIRTGDYEAFIFEMSTGRSLSFPYRFWHSRGPDALTGYSAADEALDRMKTGVTEDEIRVAVSDVMRVLRLNPPAAFLATPREVRAADKKFAIPYEPDRDVFGTLWLLRPGPVQAALAR
jgi:ABC-type transport system substrate-binding protein